MLDALRTLAQSLGPDRLGALAGLAPAEVLASPYGFRAILLALEAGATSVHVETRLDVPWPDAFASDPDVATDPHGYWDAGIWQLGKYRGFFQDAPFGTFNPNHVAKWGPHELLHRAMGFFARPGATRWEHYLGARLNELAPVALWYGHDQFLRLQEGAVDDVRDTARHADWSDVAWLRAGEDLDARAAAEAHLLERGRAHFAREFAAIEAEIESGRVRSTPVAYGAARLDASSDAIAYVVGHYERLASPRMALLLEHVLEEGVHYFADIRAYARHVRSGFERLDAGPVPTLDLERVVEGQRRRRVWDLAWRLVHHARARLGGSPDVFVEAGRLVRGDVACSEAAIADWWAEAQTLVPHSARQVVLAIGAEEARSAAVDEHRMEGVSSVAPALAEALIATGRSEALLAGLTSAEARCTRASLAERIEAHGGAATWPPTLRALWAFERALADARVSDPSVERLAGDDPEAPASDWVVVRSRAFACVALECDVAPEHAAWSDGEAIDWVAMADDEEPVAGAAYLVGAVRDGVSVVPAPPALVRLWEALREDGPAPTWAGAHAMLAAGQLAHPAGGPTDAEGWLAELVAARAIRAVPT